MDLSIFPTLNASLNALSAAFLILGYRFIRQGKREAHRMSMISACTTSLLFSSVTSITITITARRAIKGRV